MRRSRVLPRILHPFGRERSRLMAPLLVAVGVVTGAVAVAHESSSHSVRHDVLITAGPRNIDVQVELTFYEGLSMQERTRMDADEDSRISRAEAESYVAELAGVVRDAVVLRIDGRALPLLPLHEPELDLLGRKRPTAHPHRLRLSFFARTPAWFAEGSVITVEEGLWAEKPSIRSIDAVGDDGVEVGIESRNRSFRVTAAPGGARRAVRKQPVRLVSGAGRLVAARRPGVGAGQPTEGPLDAPAAVELVGRLQREHPWLLDEEQRAGLDELNRQLREVSSRREGVERPGGWQEVDAEVRALVDRLSDLLGRASSLVQISMENGRARRLGTGAVSLPGDVAALLLRVEVGAGEPRFATSRVNLALTGTRIPVEPASSGTTWALVSLENVPAGRSSLSLQLRLPEGDTSALPLDLVVPDQGRLKLTILSADSGEPAPAMVRLVWRTDGRDRKPSNAIELAHQFDIDGGLDLDLSGRRYAPLPGPLRGFYWAVPGPFDMSLPPGEWEITVRRGLEHIPVFETILIEEGQVTEKTYQPRRWVDMQERGWYSGDGHVHVRIRTDRDAENVMTWAQAEDVHVANILQMGDIHRTYFQQRGFGKEQRVVRGDYVLVPGQEDPRTHTELGHTISFNIEQAVRDTDHYFLYDQVFDQVHAQAGLVGYAHVGAETDFGPPTHRDMSMNVPKDKVDFVELLQLERLGTSLYYDFLNLGFKLTASAGSDVPWGGTVGEVRMYAYLGDQPFSADAWFEAVRLGRTFITHGPMIDLRVEEALPGDELRVDGHRTLRVRARAWGDPNRVLPGKLEIVRHGEVIWAVEPTDPDQRALELDVEVDAGHGFWIAARAEGRDGTGAHTTPIYVIREPLRFWKSEAVDELTARRLASLAEVERMVAKASDLVADDRANYEWSMLAAQGPALLERVAAARSLYEDLTRTLEQERHARGSVPTIEITGPADNGSFDLGESVLLSAEAAAYGDADVQQVQFIIDGSILGSDAESPYTFNWTASATGAHTIQARVHDGTGQTGDSALVTAYVGVQALDRSVIHYADDAEEEPDGQVNLTSSDLELVNDDGDQIVGLRFTDIAVPRGTTIKAAHVQFTAEDDESDDTDLIIYGELVANAQPFRRSAFDVSSRRRTAASVHWSPVPWMTVGERSEPQRTPDLSALIQQIVALPGWRKGNALVVLIAGSGQREAESYDGATGAPTLYLEYER